MLDALRDAGTLRRFVPFDVDRSVLLTAGTAIAQEYPGVEVAAVCGDFERHLGELPRGGRRLVAFLGSTIGNLEPGPRARCLSALAATLDPGDSLLLGTDLVKDSERLVAAYDDGAGVTTACNRNVLTIINRELKGDFDWRPSIMLRCGTPPWNGSRRLRARTRQEVNIADLDIGVVFEAGEGVRTEVSSKFRPEGVAAELAAAGLRRTHWWTDPAGDFGVSLRACPLRTSVTPVGLLHKPPWSASLASRQYRTQVLFGAPSLDAILGVGCGWRSGAGMTDCAAYSRRGWRCRCTRGEPTIGQAQHPRLQGRDELLGQGDFTDRVGVHRRDQDCVRAAFAERDNP